MLWPFTLPIILSHTHTHIVKFAILSIMLVFCCVTYLVILVAAKCVMSLCAKLGLSVIYQCHLISKLEGYISWFDMSILLSGTPFKKYRLNHIKPSFQWNIIKVGINYLFRWISIPNRYIVWFDYIRHISNLLAFSNFFF